MRRHQDVLVLSILFFVLHICLGCVPSFGVVRKESDLKRIQWEDVPDANNKSDWEACCKLCGETDKCQTWESDVRRGCILKHGTPEEEVGQHDDVVSGKRPSTGISYSSGFHRPTKLFVASHPDDDALFFGEHLKDGYHKDSFNVSFILFFAYKWNPEVDTQCFASSHLWGGPTRNRKVRPSAILSTKWVARLFMIIKLTKGAIFTVDKLQFKSKLYQTSKRAFVENGEVQVHHYLQDIPATCFPHIFSGNRW